MNSVDNGDEVLLHSYVDDQLDVDRRKDFEYRIENDPELRAKVSAYQEQNKGFHDAFDSILDEEIPTRLTNAVAEPKPGTAWFAISKRSLSMAASIVVSLIVGWLANDLYHRDESELAAANGLASQAVLAHFMYMTSHRPAMAVTDDEIESLVNGISRRLDAPVRLPDLRALGYEITGGRLLPAEIHDDAAQFMYRSRNKGMLTLYVRSDVRGESATAFRYIEEGAVGVFYWINEGLGYGLAGHMNRQDLTQVASMVKEQLKR